MFGFCAVMLALLSLICLISYWISWEVQHKARRPRFTTKLWNDSMRLLGRESGGITAPGTPSIAAQGDPRLLARSVLVQSANVPIPPV